MSAPIALLSVSNKAGLADFATALIHAGFRLLSTGGTSAALRDAGLEVQDVSDHTGHPEIMGGRVKTLHPRIHGGVLGLREPHAAEAAEHGISWIDVVVVNLYPFEATVRAPGVTLEEAIENIDIGGPTMVRAAAKNHAHVAVVTDPADYPALAAELAAGGISASTRAALALKAFRHTACYDAVIAQWLAAHLDLPEDARQRPAEGALPIRRAQTLRYGENPHQRAVFYADPGATGRALGRARQLQGKELSFNNLADIDAALRLAFDPQLAAALSPDGAAAVVIVKHHNPCGAAVHRRLPDAYRLALSADPVSAYGGVMALSRPLDGETARAIKASKVFYEVIAAPGVTDEAAAVLASRENLRVLALPEDWGQSLPSGDDARRVMGGWLVQDWDLGDPDPNSEWTLASARPPAADELPALRFAWAACSHVKSNAIVLARAEDGGLVLNGVGAGQMSRVDSVRIAISKATRPVKGSALASDAFFPFPDGVELAVEAGVTALVQPGGSIRDAEVIGAVDRASAAMLLTGVRHFRH